MQEKPENVTSIVIRMDGSKIRDNYDLIQVVYNVVNNGTVSVVVDFDEGKATIIQSA